MDFSIRDAVAGDAQDIHDMIKVNSNIAEHQRE